MPIADIIRDDLLLELVSDQLAADRESSLVYEGTSMAPVIGQGDRVEVAQADAEHLLPGQVALCLVELPGGGHGMVLHRYLGRNPDGSLRMQADTCPFGDPPVHPDHVLGKVVGVRKRWIRLRSGRFPGSLLLGPSPLMPRILPVLCKLAGYWNSGNPLPRIHLPRGSLARQHRLLLLALGEEEPLLEMVEGSSLLRCLPEERCLLPAIVYHLEQAQVAPESVLSLPGRTRRDMWRQVENTRAALNWLGKTCRRADKRALLHGPALLAWEFHPHPRCRKVEEISCLVDPGQRAGMVEALLAAGAALAEPEPGLARTLGHAQAILLRLPDRDWPLLRLGWSGVSSPYYNRRFPLSALWEHSIPGAFGVALRFMRLETALLATALQLATHMPRPAPIWALDLLALARHCPDWELLAQEASRYRIELPLAVAMNWMHDLMPGSVPVEAAIRVTQQAYERSNAFERFLMRHPRRAEHHIRHASPPEP